jgi:hypothetical protein
VVGYGLVPVSLRIISSRRGVPSLETTSMSIIMSSNILIDLSSIRYFGLGCSAKSSEVNYKASIWMVIFIFTSYLSIFSCSINTPSPQLPLTRIPLITIHLSFNHELANSPYLFKLCNLFNLPSLLPLSLISLCNSSLLFLIACILFFHHHYVIVNLLKTLSSLALAFDPPLSILQYS